MNHRLTLTAAAAVILASVSVYPLIQGASLVLGRGWRCGGRRRSRHPDEAACKPGNGGWLRTRAHRLLAAAGQPALV